MNELTFSKIVAQCTNTGATHMQAIAVALAMKHACEDETFSAMYGEVAVAALKTLIGEIV